MGALWHFDINPFITKYGLKTYFETGTGMAESLGHALKYPFEKLYTVDIDKEFIDRLAPILKSDNRLRAFNNDSVSQIKEVFDIGEISKTSNDPILWFLDAHFPGADFHKISYEESIKSYKHQSLPLEEEIGILKNNRDTSKDVIIIDDFILYDPDKEYDTVKVGNIFRYRDLVESIGINLKSDFIYKAFENTHDFSIDLTHQGYLIITPKQQ